MVIIRFSLQNYRMPNFKAWIYVQKKWTFIADTTKAAPFTAYMETCIKPN